jgi:hypothetical protein
MAYLFGTGFELGSPEFLPAADRNYLYSDVVTSPVKNGTYAYEYYVNNSRNEFLKFRNIGTPAECYAAFWCRQTTTTVNANSAPLYAEFCLSDDNLVGIRLQRVDQQHRWVAYVGSNAVAYGTFMNLDTWYHIQLRVKIADAGGVIQVKLDGNVDIDYSGDTKPGAGTTISYFTLCNETYKSNGAGYFFDDLVIRDDDWPGEVRFDAALVPTGDSVVAWTPSAGGDNYALVDEVPPSEADYVYSETDGQQDLYTLANWDGAGKTPQFVQQWLRALKDPADSQQVKMLAKLGANLDTSSAFELLTSAEYRWRCLTTRPGGGAWTDADVDDLLIGQESVIP